MKPTKPKPFANTMAAQSLRRMLRRHALKDVLAVIVVELRWQSKCAVDSDSDNAITISVNAQFVQDAVRGVTTGCSSSHNKMRSALEQMAGCNLNEDNCASLEVATRRVRNIARSALA